MEISNLSPSFDLIRSQYGVSGKAEQQSQSTTPTQVQTDSGSCSDGQCSVTSEVEAKQQTLADPQQNEQDKQEENPQGLTPEEQRVVDQLQARDREVRAHEQAHQAAAGGIAKGGAHFEFQRGPDGRSYAIGGEVQIDTSEGRSPEETLRKAQAIQAAARAPAHPSGQDYAVAREAATMATEARAELAKETGEDSPQKATDEVGVQDTESSDGDRDDDSPKLQATDETKQRQDPYQQLAQQAQASQPGSLVNVQV